MFNKFHHIPFLILLLIASFLKISAQSGNFNISIDENFEVGGNSGDEIIDFLIDTDGSIYVIGETSSNDFDFAGIPSGYNAFIMKISSTGSVLWYEAIGGGTNEHFYSLYKSSDGFLYVGGKSIVNSNNTLQSISGIASQNTSGGNATNGVEDGILLKISTTGIVQWIRSYGGLNPDLIVGIHDHPNGDLSLVANTFSNGTGDVPSTVTGLHKIWMFTVQKTNGNISTINSAFLGSVNGSNVSLNISDTHEVADGIIATGFANPLNSTSGCAPTSSSQDLVLLLKLNNSGNLVWDKYYGANGSQKGRKLDVNVDGSIVICGYSSSASNSCDVQSTSNGNQDVYVVKTDANGVFNWGYLYGGSLSDDGSGIVELPNGNYLISAYTNSTIGGITNQGVDVYVFEIDSNGNNLNNLDLLGGGLNDVQGVAGSSILTSDCYLYKDSSDKVWMGTSSKSNDGDLPLTLTNTTSFDIWIVGFDDTSLMNDCNWIGYVNNPFTNYREPNEMPCVFVDAGVARIDPSETNQTTYWTGFLNPNNFNVSGDEIVLEARLKNPASEGGIFCYDMEMWLFGEDNYAAVGFMTTATSCEEFAFIGTSDNYQTGLSHNLSALQFNTNNFSDLKLELSSNSISVYRNNALLRNISYTQLLGNLRGIKIAFKGSGSADWVKLIDNGTIIYEENFNDCSTICPNCNTSMELHQYILPSGGYEASDYIECSASIESNNVELKAVNEVTLESGFETKIGAILEVIIDACTF